jgi:hypothetical protein
MLTVHVFRCSNDPALCAYTPDPTGANLPGHVPEGMWTYFTTLWVTSSQNRVGVDSDALVRDVEERGYHLARSGVPLTPEGNEQPGPPGGEI